jgi:arylsulfatase A-like enzyme
MVKQKNVMRSVLVIICSAVAIISITLIIRSARGPRSGETARHVIFVSFDTARADHLGCYGNGWIRTPRIDELATESILFTDYMTVAPTTLASHTTLLTGKYPHAHGTPRNGFTVNEQNIMLPEILKNEGYHTVGFSGCFALSAQFGFAQGFDHYDEGYLQNRDTHFFGSTERAAKAVTDAAIEYLEAHEIAENLFLFLHYFDPHKPYRPPDEYASPYNLNDDVSDWLESVEGPPVRGAFDMRSAYRYAGEMSYMDEHFGRMLDYLDECGILEEALLVVTSDHGEHFWGHPPPWDHGSTVHQCAIDAICMIKLPHGRNGGTKVEQLFASIDVFPSVLTYLGLEIPPEIDGEAIDLAASPIEFPPRTRLSQATKPHLPVGTEVQWMNIRNAACVREGRWKYVYTPWEGTEELYDLEADPNELHDLLADPTPESRAQADRLRPALNAWVESAAPLPSDLVREDRDKVIEKLRSLGYLR